MTTRVQTSLGVALRCSSCALYEYKLYFIFFQHRTSLAAGVTCTTCLPSSSIVTLTLHACLVAMMSVSMSFDGRSVTRGTVQVQGNSLLSIPQQQHHMFFSCSFVSFFPVFFLLPPTTPTTVCFFFYDCTATRVQLYIYSTRNVPIKL